MMNYKNLFAQKNTVTPNNINIRVVINLCSILLLYLLVSTSAIAKILSRADFESGDYRSGKWGISGNKDKVFITSAPSPVCSGQFSAKFQINTKFANTHRTELVGGRHPRFNIGDEYWVGLAIYLPKDWKLDQAAARNAESPR